MTTTFTVPFRHAFDNKGFYNVYGLPSLPEGVEILNPKTEREMGNKKRIKWSGETAVPPAIGARVYVEANSQGYGTVCAYFIEYNWLGLHVELDAMPKWILDQRKRREQDDRDEGRQPEPEFYPDHVFVFGCDLDEQTRVK